MLVVSRRSADKISFPQVGITVHFIRVQGGTARVGVEAPRDIVIVRDEIADDPDAAARLREKWALLPKEVRHEIRNELHAISIGLHLYKEQIRTGVEDEALGTFQEILDAIKRIDDHEILRRPVEKKVGSLPGTVLVVEDQENEREMLAGFLRMRGHTVVALADGRAALDYLHSHDEPSVILVDMSMPVCNGGEMVRQIRSEQRHAGLRVFAISASAPEDNDLEIGTQGVDRWFRKPVNPQFLVDAI